MEEETELLVTGPLAWSQLGYRGNSGIGQEILAIVLKVPTTLRVYHPTTVSILSIGETGWGGYLSPSQGVTLRGDDTGLPLGSGVPLGRTLSDPGHLGEPWVSAHEGKDDILELCQVPRMVNATCLW